MRPRRSIAALATATAAVTVTALGVAPTAASAAPTDLFISEYVEGSSNNKAIELFNGTGAAVDLAAGGYQLQLYFNGSTTATTIALTGSVAAGDAFVFASASAGAAILAQADQTSGASLFNGDDAIVLRRGTTVLDSIGQVGRRPGHRVGRRRHQHRRQHPAPAADRDRRRHRPVGRVRPGRAVGRLPRRHLRRARRAHSRRRRPGRRAGHADLRRAAGHRGRHGRDAAR